MADLGVVNNVNSSLTSSLLANFSYGFLPLFYLVPPHHTYFKDITDIPPYVQQVESNDHTSYVYLCCTVGHSVFLDTHIVRGGSIMV